MLDPRRDEFIGIARGRDHGPAARIIPARAESRSARFRAGWTAGRLCAHPRHHRAGCEHDRDAHVKNREDHSEQKGEYYFIMTCHSYLC